MANKGNIDPAFQAAPFLGESSHDPIEFTRRQTMLKYQRGKQRQEEIQRNVAIGLDQLKVKLDGWNDKGGFDQINERLQKSKNFVTELASKGVNIFNPITPEDVTAYKAASDYIAQTKELADIRNSQKVKTDAIYALLKADELKNPEDQVVNRVKTEANLSLALKGKTIEERDEILNNALVLNPQIGDVQKFISSIKDRITKPPVKTWQSPDENGVLQTYTSEVSDTKTDEQIYKDLRNQYKYAPTEVKNYIKQQGELNKGNEPVGFTDEDRFITIAKPAYKEKFSQKAATSKSGFNAEFKFLGASGEINPGELQSNDLVYGGRHFNGRYEFSFPTTKTFFIPPAGGEYATQDKWEPITEAGGPLEGNLLFYDPKTDALIFKTTQDARYPWTKNNTTISIPRKNLAKADELPIMVDGKKKTLKDILPAEAKQRVGQNSVLKNSGISWK
jgi:translation elongation factor EF-1beta